MRMLMVMVTVVTVIMILKCLLLEGKEQCI